MIKKKGDVDPAKVVVGLLVLLIAAAIIGYIYYTSGERSLKVVKGQIDLLGDDDNDRVINRDDECCPAACDPAGLPVGECPGNWCGCTELQGYTDCAATKCNFDYDHDNVLNEKDQCCAPQCAPDIAEEVNLVDCQKDPVGPRCGCAQNQVTTRSDADVNVVCSQPAALIS